MSTWQKQSAGTETCEKCGSIYSVTVVELPTRDKDNFNCITCGAELKSWNGTRMYSYELVKKG